MQLAQRDKELAAIGASIGCTCRPCIEHHLPAGRNAGLSEAELADAVATARAVRDEAIELLAPRVDQLLGRGGAPSERTPAAGTSIAQELVALGASIGANSHPLIHRHVAAAHELGLSFAELAAAARMAEYVQKRASEFTADAVKDALDGVRSVARDGALAADAKT